MKQLSLAETGFLPKAGKQTRKAVFLSEMETVLPWSRLEALIEPFYPKKGNGRPPMPSRTHFMQQWFGYSDPAMEEALHDIPLPHQFTGLDAFEDVMPDDSTILRFRHLLEQNELAVSIFAEANAVLNAKGHRADYAVFIKPRVEGVAGILAVRVGMMDQSRRRFSAKPRHGQCIDHIIRHHPELERPADDLPVEQVEHKRPGRG